MNTISLIDIIKKFLQQTRHSAQTDSLRTILHGVLEQGFVGRENLAVVGNDRLEEMDYLCTMGMQVGEVGQTERKVDRTHQNRAKDLSQAFGGHAIGRWVGHHLVEEGD